MVPRPRHETDTERYGVGTAAALLGPSVTVKDVPESDQCAHLDSGPIARLMGMDLHLYTKGGRSTPNRSTPA